MINNKKPLHQIISETILNVFYTRINPFTEINFVTNAYSKTEMGLEKQGPFQALKELKKQVSEVVQATGVTMYKGVSIWDISVYEMKVALPLIKIGLVKQDDFNSSPISKVRNPIYLTCIDTPDEISRQLRDEGAQFNELARSVAKTEKEFKDLSFNCSYYKNHMYRIISFTNKITAFIEKTGITSYNGVGLYDITELDLLTEAFKALNLIKFLKREFHITHYNDKPIEQLNYFILRKIEKNAEDENYEGLTIDKPAPPVKEELFIPDHVQQQWDENKIQAEKEKKALRTMVKRIVQAELKKAEGQLAIKTPTGRPVKKSATKATVTKKN